MKTNKTFISDLSKKEFPMADKVSGKMIRNGILTLIKEDYPDFSRDQFISIEELNLYREKYISDYLLAEIGQLSTLENKVVDSLTEDKSLVSTVEEEVGQRTYGQKVADKVAAFGGSWKFIISFGVFIVLWILTNVFILSFSSLASLIA